MTCQEVNGLPHSCLNDKAVDSSVSASGLNSELHDYMTSFSPKLDFDDGDIDDELDPVMKEELDRFVRFRQLPSTIFACLHVRVKWSPNFLLRRYMHAGTQNRKMT